MGLTSDDIFVSGSIYAGRIRLLSSLMPVVFICLAAKHLYDCPKQPMVPIYLLVGGVLILCVQLIPFCYCKQSNGTLVIPCKIFSFLLLLFCPVWFITGSVFTYMAYEPNYESRWSPEYCERMLYKSTFWITNAIYVSIPIILIGHCLNRLSKSCFEKKKQCHIITIS